MSMSIEECKPYECINCGGSVNPLTDVCFDCGCDVSEINAEDYNYDYEFENDYFDDIELL